MIEEYNEDLVKADNEQQESVDYSETPSSNVVAFNELQSSTDLVKMNKMGQLIYSLVTQL